jgi:TonB family protein
MTALTLNHEFGEMRVRFQRTLTISIGLHVLFFGWLILNRQLAPARDQIVEITWLEQAPRPVQVTPEPEQIKPVLTRVVPKPELSVKEKLALNSAGTEQVRHKMTALQPSEDMAKALSTMPTTSANLLNTAQATMAPIIRSEKPANLNRGGGTKESAVALTRGPTSSHRTTAVAAALPTQAPSRGAGAAQPDPGSAAVQNLGGATLRGLVADRRVINHTMPIYPAWATTEAVEATVTLYFLVLPSGQVKQNVQIQKNGGGEFDQNAIAAIRQWRFEALDGSEAREQWGTITFRYRLNN